MSDTFHNHVVALHVIQAMYVTNITVVRQFVITW